MPQVPEELTKHACLGYSYGASANEWQFNGAEGEHRISITGNMRANNGDLLRVAALWEQGFEQLNYELITKNQ